MSKVKVEIKREGNIGSGSFWQVILAVGEFKPNLSRLLLSFGENEGWLCLLSCPHFSFGEGFVFLLSASLFRAGHCGRS